MCDICDREIICIDGCPNKTEENAIYFCDECGMPIHRGDIFVKINSNRYCENRILCTDCVENLSREEIIETLGADSVIDLLEEYTDAVVSIC